MAFQFIILMHESMKGAKTLHTTSCKCWINLESDSKINCVT